jgi:hypothetical protein
MKRLALGALLFLLPMQMVYPPTTVRTTITSSATPTPVCAPNGTGILVITALATSATIAAPSGTCYDGDQVEIMVIDNSSSQTIGWNGIYSDDGTNTLPTATTMGKWMYLMFNRNVTANKWHFVASHDGF